MGFKFTYQNGQYISEPLNDIIEEHESFLCEVGTSFSFEKNFTFVSEPEQFIPVHIH